MVDSFHLADEDGLRLVKGVIASARRKFGKNEPGDE
jgi:hypothetical protein